MKCLHSAILIDTIQEDVLMLARFPFVKTLAERIRLQDLQSVIRFPQMIDTGLIDIDAGTFNPKRSWSVHREPILFRPFDTYDLSRLVVLRSTTVRLIKSRQCIGGLDGQGDTRKYD